MRIMYIITKSNWGGAQRHVYDLALAMRARGHEVNVALGGSGELQHRLESAGIFTHSIAPLGRDISVSKEAGSLKEIFSIIKSKRPDIIHLHSPKAAGLGALAGRLLGVKKIIYTVHGWPFNEDRSLYQKLLIIFFSWLTMVLATDTILLSEKEREQASRFPGTKGKLTTIPLGIKPPVFLSIEGAKQMLGKHLNADLSRRFVFGTIAELHRNKGLNYLIEAMAQIKVQHPKALCVIIGDGEEREHLQKKIGEAGLEDCVRLAGYLPEASEYLKAFNVFVLPSIKEGLPYVIIESGYASLPVISTTVGGIPELIEDMKSGILIQPKKSRELAHAISFMLEQTDARRKYGQSLRERVIANFSFERMISEIDKLIADR